MPNDFDLNVALSALLMIGSLASCGPYDLGITRGADSGDSGDNDNSDNTGTTIPILSAGDPSSTSSTSDTDGMSTTQASGMSMGGGGSGASGGADSSGNPSTSTGSTTTGDIERPDYCQGDGLELQITCEGSSEDLYIEVNADLTIPANSMKQIEIPVGDCGDDSKITDGIVVGVHLADACLWSMRLSLICPAGEELELVSKDMCGACSELETFEAIFRTTGTYECAECDFESGSCDLQPSGENMKTLCGDYLAKCKPMPGEPWHLQIEAGPSAVTIESVSMRMALHD